MPSLFSLDVRAATVKPAPGERSVIDRAVPAAAGLRSVLLFEGHRLTDLSNPIRLISKRGSVAISQGLHGAQARTAMTGTTGLAASPCLLLAPTDAALSTLTVSALVRFNGTGPVPGSFNTIGAALAGDDSGRMPLFVSTAADTFRVRAGVEAEFLSGGQPLNVASLTGWHRVTVTIAANVATLYVDGGATFTGTATQSFPSFTLRSVLGSDVTLGTEWPWPTADMFYWSRALSAQEVLNHSVGPYRVLKSRLAERWTNPTVTAPPVDPGGRAWDDEFTIDFGNSIAFGVIAQIRGVGRLTATAAVMHSSPPITVSRQIDGAGFLHIEGFVLKSPSFATVSGEGTLTANPIVRRMVSGLDGVGNVVGFPRQLRSAVSLIDGTGSLSARPGIGYTARAAQRGQGNILTDPFILEPFNRGRARFNGMGTLTANAVVRAAPVNAATLRGSGTLNAVGILQRARGRSVILGTARLYARPTIIRRPRMRPGIASGAAPDFVAVEIETYVPGNTSVIAVAGHGTRAHGTLTRLPPASKPETTAQIFASDIGYRTSPSDPLSPPVRPYPPLVNEAYQIDTALSLEPARTSSAASWGTLLLANPNRTFDDLIGVQNSDGRPVRILSGRKGWDSSLQYLTDPNYASLTLMFSGLAAPWSLTDDGLSIPLRDATYFIERPLQPDVFGGSGGLDGTQDLAGKPRPILRGGTASSPVQNITPVLIDPANRIYQYSDGPGSIVALYEGGATGSGAITPAGDTTNLYAGTTPFGRYRTDNSRGLFQLGSVPVAAITIDAVGLFPIAGAVNHPFMICRYLMSEDMTLPESMLHVQSFADLAAAYPSYVAGMYFGSDEQWSCVQAIDAILSALGANIVPTRDGKLRLMLLRDISGAEPVVGNYNEATIISLRRRPLPASLDPPPYRIRVGYQHNYTVMTSDINQSLTTADRRQFIASPDRFATFVDLTLLRAYRKPNDYAQMPSPLLTLAAAQSVANDLGSLWGAPRRLYDVILPRRLFGHELGDVVQVHYPIEQLTSGKDCRVVGYSLRASDATVTYTVLA